MLDRLVVEEVERMMALDKCTLCEIDILNLASRLKRKEISESGKIKEIAQDAEEEYRRALMQLDKCAYEVYERAKTLSKNEKEDFFRSNPLPVEDRGFKMKRIENALKIDLSSDQGFIDRAKRTILHKTTQSRINKYWRMYSVLPEHTVGFEDCATLALYLTRGDNATLNENALNEALFAKPNNKVDIFFYLCLRLTHDTGEPHIINSDEDHKTKDKNGEQVIFYGAPIRKQWTILSQMAKENNGSTNITAVICDFDLKKFGDSTYSRFANTAEEYRLRVENYLKGSNIRTMSEIGYFDSLPGFRERFDDCFDSINSNDGKYMSQNEVDRASQGYAQVFSGTLHNWTPERNQFYTSMSLARNITEGIFLGDTLENPVFCVFNKALVNGIRLNMAARKRIPCIGFPKPH